MFRVLESLTLVIKSELGNTGVCLGAPGLRGNIVKSHCSLGKQSRREREMKDERGDLVGSTACFFPSVKYRIIFH